MAHTGHLAILVALSNISSFSLLRVDAIPVHFEAYYQKCEAVRLYVSRIFTPCVRVMVVFRHQESDNCSYLFIKLINDCLHSDIKRSNHTIKG